jgi:hypothetical protein
MLVMQKMLVILMPILCLTRDMGVRAQKGGCQKADSLNYVIGKRKTLYFDKLLKISVSSSGPTFALASLIACWLQFLQIVKSIGFINNTSF